MVQTTVNLLVFGASGLCGRAMVERAIAESNHREMNLQFQVTAFVRNEQKAKSLFEKHANNDRIIYQVGDIYSAKDVANAVYKADAIINFLSSYTQPHNQMSTLVEHVLQAVRQQPQPQQPDKITRLVHFGYRRGHGAHGTGGVENAIVQLTEWLSCTKYGPAIRDHKQVAALLILESLESDTSRRKTSGSLDWCMFAAPSMVD
jgi:uncharacterized protein YbjT (DUF2867 family)